MEISNGILIAGLGLNLVKENILVISDTQIGYEESLNSQGILVPRIEYKETKARLEKLINLINPSHVIINGDIKHEFGRVSRTEWKNTLDLIDFVCSKSRLILIKGNHDSILSPIAEKKGIKLIDHYFRDGIYLCHGHKIPEDDDFKRSKAVIIGHAHPAVGLRENERVEKYKCFLKGRYKNKSLIVLPSFNSITVGTDILSEKPLSPFLDRCLDDFEVFVASEDGMYFGKIKDLS
jgi:putative SbcD/Mre11-related phosphoesterase